MSSEPKESSGAIVAEDVLETLSQQCALYRRLKLLADRQHALVSSSASQELLAVLAERQKVISAIQAVDRAIRAARDQWPAVYEGMDGSQRAEADARIEEAQGLLSEILAGDDRDAEVLSARAAGARSEASTVSHVRRAHAAYGATATAYAPKGGTVPPRFVDQTDEQG